MLLALCLLICVLPLSCNPSRTPCFQYVSCLENAHRGLRQCAGDTSLALALEAKEKPFADFIQEHKSTTMGCQERFSADSFDFEVLQVLVNDDARECFQRLPKSRRLHRSNTMTCPYEESPAKSSFGQTPFGCFATFRSERQKCEQLLQCCPDHLRCGERLNSVSVAYQHAKSRANEIVQRLLLCLGSGEPQSFLEVAAMQVDRMRFRVPGVPFLKPDRETEQRIARRLSLMSYAAIEQRREKHVKKFQQVRERLISERQLEVANLTTPPIQSAPISSEERVAIVRNLFRNANEKELATYASLLAEGNFVRLAELEKRKSTNSTGSQMKRFREVIKASLLSKNPKTFDYLASSTTSSRGIFGPPTEAKEANGSLTSNENVDNDAPHLLKANPPQQELETVQLVDSSSGQKYNSLTHGLRNNAIEKADPLRGLFEGQVINLLKEAKKVTSIPALGLTKVYKNKVLPLAESKVISVVTKTTINESANGSEVVSNTTTTIPVQLPPSTQGNTVSKKDLHHTTAKRKNKNSTRRKTKCDVEPTTSNPISTTTSISTVIAETNITADGTQAFEDIEMEGSTAQNGQEVEAAVAILSMVDTTPSHFDKESESVEQSRNKNETLTTIEPHLASENPSQKFNDEPRQGTSCAIYAACLETIRDYEDACEQRYAKDYIAHGIDDSEILRILNASSIDQGTIVHKACLRSLDKSDYAMVKQLLLTQRSLRKHCLEHGIDRSSDIDEEGHNCPRTLPSTESIDNYLYQTHYRMENNRLTCHALLDEMKAVCSTLEKCCPSTKSCESQAWTRTLEQRLEDAIGRLIGRHNACEQNMLETLKIVEAFRDDQQQTRRH